MIKICLILTANIIIISVYLTTENWTKTYVWWKMRHCTRGKSSATVHRRSWRLDYHGSWWHACGFFRLDERAMARRPAVCCVLSSQCPGCSATQAPDCCCCNRISAAREKQWVPKKQSETLTQTSTDAETATFVPICRHTDSLLP